MKKYEYKIVITKLKLGFDYEKKCKDMEDEWNNYGQDGWKFCSWANDSVIFMREIPD